MSQHTRLNAIQVHEKHIKPVLWNEDSAIPRKFFDASQNCNPHEYTFILNNRQKCSPADQVFMLILIRSVPKQLDRRMAIRETWGSSKNLPKYNLPVIFIFGKTYNKTEQDDLKEESRVYNDIVQEDFVDSYQTLTLKTVMAWKWALLFCPQASYVMIANDEVVVDVFKLVPYLQSIQGDVTDPPIKRAFSLCFLFPCCTRVLRRHPKYNLSQTIYDGQAYPSYCSGTGYVAPSSVIHDLYHMSVDTPMFMPDDAWVGVLAEKLGVGFTDTYKSYTGISSKPTVMRDFNSSTYLLSPVLFGVVDYDFPGKEATIIRILWDMIVTRHKHDYSQIDVNTFMANYYKHKDPDSHVSQVAGFVFLVEFLVMSLVGYAVFCGKSNNFVKRCFSFRKRVKHKTSFV